MIKTEEDTTLITKTLGMQRPALKNKIVAEVLERMISEAEDRINKLKGRIG